MTDLRVMIGSCSLDSQHAGSDGPPVNVCSFNFRYSKTTATIEKQRPKQQFNSEEKKQSDNLIEKKTKTKQQFSREKQKPKQQFN